MSPFDVPLRPRPKITNVRDWISAYGITTPVTIQPPHAKAKDWVVTALRVCRITQDMGCLTLRVNAHPMLVFPLAALANGEWFTLRSSLMLADGDEVTVTSDFPITLALAGLYVLRDAAAT